MIHRSLVAGVPFPDVYDWTWGEAIEFIDCTSERQRDDSRLMASMLFHTATLLSRIVAGQGNKQMTVMDAYSFLWTDDDRKKAAAERRHASLHTRAKPKQEMSLDEQDRLLSEMKQKILAEREKK